MKKTFVAGALAFTMAAAFLSGCGSNTQTKAANRLEEIQQQLRMLKEKYDADIRILNTPDMEIASADIRGRIAGGEDISQMLPAEVEAYIRSHHLYEKR